MLQWILHFLVLCEFQRMGQTIKKYIIIIQIQNNDTNYFSKEVFLVQLVCRQSHRYCEFGVLNFFCCYDNASSWNSYKINKKQLYQKWIQCSNYYLLSKFKHMWQITWKGSTWREDWFWNISSCIPCTLKMRLINSTFLFRKLESPFFSLHSGLILSFKLVIKGASMLVNDN